MPLGRTHDHVAMPAASSTVRSQGRAPLVKRVAILVAAAATAITLLPGSSLADPTPPELTIDQVRVQVDELYEQLEIAAETANDAKVRADDVRANLETLNANLDRLQADFDDATASAGTFAAAQYRSSGFDPTVQMMLAEDPGNFLTRMSQLDQLADQQARAVDALAAAKASLAQQELAIERESARLDALEATTAEAEAAADARHREATALLDRLTAEEAARLEAARLAAEQAAAVEQARRVAAQAPASDTTQSTETTVPSVPAGPVSGRAKIAVDFAMAQIGKSYSYGAAGPGAYDCSGLTMAAWAAAGVGLPHSSQGQMSSGPSVSASELQPGDLVFYYSPVHHVGMYIGNGMIVHASRPGKPIGVAPLYSMPYSGAVRVG